MFLPDMSFKSEILRKFYYSSIQYHCECKNSTTSHSLKKEMENKLGGILNNHENMKCFLVCYERHNRFGDQYGLRVGTEVTYFDSGCAELSTEAEKFHKVCISQRNFGCCYPSITSSCSSIETKLI